MGKNGSTSVYKVVLTGGPCGGKTTAQSRICTFFENLGWKVYRVPETAATLLGGGVKFSDLDENETYNFQKNLLKVMMAIEDTFFTLASTCKRNCLVICDRGTMDASAYIQPEKWERIIREINLNPVDIRDNRYNQIIHLVTAARGAKEFYVTEENCSRYESAELACELDSKTSSAWVGHPYYDVIDNATDFEMKQMKVIKALCQRIGVETGDRLAPDASKIKFLVAVPLPPDDKFPPFQDFDVVHDYLTSATRKVQARLRKRGQKGNWTYSHTIRGPEILGQTPETKMQISHREYVTMMAERSPHNYSVFKTRRCFLWENQYFQMDIYREPCHPRCQGLVLLETYSTLPSSQVELPAFLNIVRECTGDPQYSMYNLSLKEDWANSTKFITNLSDDSGPSRTPDNLPAVNGTL